MIHPHSKLYLLGRLDDTRMNFVTVTEEEEAEIEELSNMMTMHDFLVVVSDLNVVEENFLHWAVDLGIDYLE